MASAEIITIGTEILLGEIVDTNAAYIARALREIGIDIYHMVSVGDNAQRIAQAIRQACERSNVVITTGGLGPTVDDPTREAVALAVGGKEAVPLEFRPELWEQIQQRFKRFGRIPTENNRRQAYLPTGALAIENPVGTAPAFLYESIRDEKLHWVIIALPGVPREMEYLMQNAVIPYLRQRFPGTGVIKSRILHVAGVGESQIDELIGDLETYQNPTVGLAAHAGQIDIRITAKACSTAEADALIKPVEKILYDRLGDWIYGADQDTLELVALQTLKRLNYKLAILEAGLNGALTNRISRITNDFQPQGNAGLTESFSRIFLGGEVIAKALSPDELEVATRDYCRTRRAEVCLGVTLIYGFDSQEIHYFLITPSGCQHLLRTHGGPPQHAPEWAVNHGLNMIRKLQTCGDDF